MDLAIWQDCIDEIMSAVTGPSIAEEFAQRWSLREGNIGSHTTASRSADSTSADRGTVLLVGSSIDAHLAEADRQLRRRGIPTVSVQYDRRPVLSGHGFRAPSQRTAVRSAFCRWLDPTKLMALHGESAGVVIDPWSAVSPRTRNFATNESRMALLGLLETFEPRIWINGYWETLRAEVKSRQLAIASANGLRSPRSIVTDDPNQVRAFADEVGGHLVYKSLDDPFVYQGDGTAGFLFTSGLSARHLSRLDVALVHPGLFQERLNAVEEYRVTVVGERVFVASASTDGSVDWRRALKGGVTFARASLDSQSLEAILRTVKALDLTFAAVDLVRTTEDIYFLEANPSGAYLWLEHALGFPITASICDRLTTP
jgi:glutathione synthase/RimK-type ligase-like ATP-grasp enzyme